MQPGRPLFPRGSPLRGLAQCRGPSILARIDTSKQADNLFRTCIPGADAEHALCVFVNTDSSPPAVRLDPDHEPNVIGR